MTLSVRIEGDGPDLALIHGWGFPGAVWDPVIEPLARHFRVHCVDLPGYGASRDAAGGSIQSIADRLMAALPEQVTLCGWSLGAHFALAATARHASQVRELVLVGASPCFVKRPDWADAVDGAMLELFSATLKKSPRSLLSRFSTLINFGDRSAREIVPVLAALAEDPPDSEALNFGLEILRDLDLRPLLGRIRHRTLIVHGESDPLMPLAAARWVAQQMPRATLEVVAGAAHSPFLARGEAFARRLAAFVGAGECGVASPC